MNKRILIWIIGTITLSLTLGGYFILSGNAILENGIFKGVSAEETVYQKDVSTLILDASELPKGYTIAEKTPRVKSDVSEFGINIGWEEGYYTKYLKGIDEDSQYISRIELHISRYPLNNISKTMQHINKYEGYTLDELPSPQIGEKSLAARYTENELGTREYQIEFYKKDIYVRVMNGGALTDYELLKDLAKKIESKI